MALRGFGRFASIVVVPVAAGVLAAGCNSSAAAPAAPTLTPTCAHPLPKDDLVTGWDSVGSALGVVNTKTGRGHMVPGSLAYAPEGVALSRDRCRIAFGSEQLQVKNGPEMPGGVFVVNVDGTGLRQIPHLNTGIGFQALSWSPDDRSLAVLNASGYLLVGSLKGRLEGYKLPLRQFMGSGGVGWDEHGNVLVLASPLNHSSSSFGGVVVRLGPHGDHRVILTHRALPGSAVYGTPFAVSGDGRNVLLAVLERPTLNSPVQMVEVSLVTHHVTTLLSGRPVGAAAWAPDDQSIAYLMVPAADGQARIHILRGGQTTVLPSGHSTPDLALAWG